MSKPFRVQKAPIESIHLRLKELQLPVFSSFKYDGIRGHVDTNTRQVLSSTNKPISSRQVQERFGNCERVDGELVCGSPVDPLVFNISTSHISSFDKPHDDLKMYVFDLPDHPGMYFERYTKLKEVVAADPRLTLVKMKHHETIDSILEEEHKALELGYEGLMLINPLTYYREGRCTFNDQTSFKLKRFTDEEAVVVGFEERMTNLNVSVHNEMGLLKKSDTKDAKVGAGMVGKFIVEKNGKEFTVAPGKFTHIELKDIWENQAFYRFKLLKYRYFGYGMLDLPRFPRAIGWRDE